MILRGEKAVWVKPFSIATLSTENHKDRMARDRTSPLPPPPPTPPCDAGDDRVSLGRVFEQWCLSKLCVKIQLLQLEARALL